MSPIPDTMRAVAQHPAASAPNSIPFAPSPGMANMAPFVQEVPVPKLGDNDVLIKVAFAAQNPTDFKHAYYMAPPRAILGCDYSGVVVKLGENVKNSDLKVGDRVAGCVHGGLFQDKGSYAEYLKAQSDLLFKVPSGMSLEEAATFGVPWVTALQTLVHEQGQKLPPHQVGDEWVLIYGGSTSVGLLAIQLAKAMGYKVVTTASPHSFDLVKNYGADEIVDYHNATEASARIKQISGGGVTKGLDCLSEPYTIDICLDAFREGEGQLNLILPLTDESAAKRPEIKKPFTLMYSLLGQDWNQTPLGPETLLPSPPADYQFGLEIFKRSTDIIETYNIKPLPTKVRGGLADVPKGWEEQAAGKVSGVKYVYEVEP